MADAEVVVEEEWIRLTQATLGVCVEKPRLMPDRLRKPPFRFLFDVMLEVARQTGFGAAELFAGEVASKPTAPGTREEKLHFLEHWLLLIGNALGPRADLALVSPTDIACGKNAHWTNYLLQCTAAAAWPDRWEPPPQPVPSLELAPDTEGETAPSHHHSASGIARMSPTRARTQEQSPEAPRGGEGEAAPDSMQVAVEIPVHVTDNQGLTAAEPSSSSAAGSPKHHATASGGACCGFEVPDPRVAMPDHHAEASGNFSPMNEGDVASHVDLLKSLEEYEALQEEFTRTAEAWKAHSMNKEASNGNDDIEADDPAARPDDADDDVAPMQRVSSAMLANGGAFSSAQTLSQARMVTQKVDASIHHALDLLSTIEEGLDRADLEILKKREAALEKKRQALQEAQEKAEAEAAEKEAAAAEHAARKRAEKEARRAERERRREDKAKELAKPKYPVSRSTAEQGARVVACIGDSDYHQKLTEEDAEEDSGHLPGDAVAAAVAQHHRSPEVTSAGGAALGDGPGSVSLFEELKVQLKETFVSYLAASMPESLLRQYKAQDLVACLQILLTELRKELQSHSLEDIIGEAPTALSEELQEHFPTDWLPHLQTHSAFMLCEKYNNPELVDTLQSLCQVALERLEDNLGPVQQWIQESSPLRYHDPYPLPRQFSPREGQGSTVGQDSLTVAAAAPAPTSTHAQPGPGESGFSATASRLKTSAGHNAVSSTSTSSSAAVAHHHHQHHNHHPPPSRQAPPTSYSKSLGPPLWEQPHQAPIPTFDKTLGPPIWEQEATARRPSPTPQTRGTAQPGAQPGQQGHGAPFHQSRPATHAAAESLRFR